MTESPESYMDCEPPARVCVDMPGRYMRELRKLAEVHTDGDVEAMVLRLVIREMDPVEAAMMEHRSEA